VSANGAFVQSSKPLPVGESVTLHFDRGQRRNPLTFDAEVVRVANSRAGQALGLAVRFTSITDLDETLIADLIDRAAN
jgi:hypothetical protein